MLEKSLKIRHLREKYSEDKFMVRHQEYAPGAQFSGTMEAGRCFVLAGRASFETMNGVIELFEELEVCLPRGSYKMRILGDKTFEQVMVWELPTPNNA